jgi:hypothetical protein
MGRCPSDKTRNNRETHQPVMAINAH